MHGPCMRMRHAQERREKETRNKEQGTWQIPSPSHMATAGGHSFFSYDYLFLTWGSLGFFNFTCLTLLYCTVPTYVRSPSFSEKQGRSDQVIFLCLGTRPNSKGEILLLVHGTAGTSGCHVARKFILCLSLSLFLRMNRSQYLVVSIKSHILLTARITALSSGQEDPVSSAKAR